MSFFACHSCWSFGENYEVCGKCRVTHYCSRGCQHEDWSSHKTNCKKNVAKKEHHQHLRQCLLMLMKNIPAEEWDSISYAEFKDENAVVNTQTLERIWLKVKDAYGKNPMLTAAITTDGDAKTTFDTMTRAFCTGKEVRRLSPDQFARQLELAHQVLKQYTTIVKGWDHREWQQTVAHCKSLILSKTKPTTAHQMFQTLGAVISLWKKGCNNPKLMLRVKVPSVTEGNLMQTAMRLMLEESLDFEALPVPAHAMQLRYFPFIQKCEQLVISAQHLSVITHTPERSSECLGFTIQYELKKFHRLRIFRKLEESKTHEYYQWNLSGRAFLQWPMVWDHDALFVDTIIDGKKYAKPISLKMAFKEHLFPIFFQSLTKYLKVAPKSSVSSTTEQIKKKTT